MLRNYLKIAFRIINRHKGYSFINISGLAIGMACCILIMLWVQGELSFDKFHENSNDLYVVVTSTSFGSKVITYPGTPPAFGPAVEQEYPEIINTARFNNGQTPLVLAHGEKKFRERVQIADASVLEMFTFPLVQGHPATALSNPHSIVMTERMAEKYFGSEDPLGKIIRVDNTYDFTVTGILKSLPYNSSIQFDFLVPLAFFDDLRGEAYLRSWGNLSFRTYVQLQSHISYENVSQKIADRIEREGEENCEAFLHPFSRLYLHWLDRGGGRIGQVRMFSLIALFVLLIACINFMNLTTARSGNRAKEIGIRKVVGAYKNNIIKQFYGESILLSFLSLLIAIGLVELLFPAFTNLVGRGLILDFFRNPALIFSFLGITLLTGVIAGTYPAIIMSSFQPARTIKGFLGSSTRSSRFRKILVVLQFTISISLIIGTIAVYKQLRFMSHMDLGFDKEHLIYSPVGGSLAKNYEAAKQELLQSPDILHATVTSHVPTGIYWNGSGWNWEGKDPKVDPLVTYFCVDADFIGTFKTEMAEGEFFSKEDITSGAFEWKVIINEEFARITGKEALAGERLSIGAESYVVAGVIKDFNFKPLEEEIGPIAIFLPWPRRINYMFMRIDPENIPGTISHAKKVFQQFDPEFPFEYRFLDEDFDRLYRSEQRTGRIINIFAALTIIISCLGLFGLASFMVEQRTKEIGIRKVLGSSFHGIILLLSKEFLKWIVLANLIAWPLAYYYTSRWLQDFAYRTGLGLDVFVLTGMLSLAIALATVSYQAIKAARANPIESLRYE